MAKKWEALCLVALMLLEEEEEKEKLYNKKRKACDFWVAGIPKKKRTPTARKPTTSSSQELSNVFFKSPDTPQLPRAIRKRARSSSSESNTAVPLRPSKDIPVGLKERILNGMGGTDLRAVLEKPLRQTDVSPGHGRLSMPSGHLIGKSFLSEDEEALVTEGAGMDVVVVDEELREYKLRLKKWNMSRRKILNLTTAWNDVVNNNTLRKNSLVQLWSFRRHTRLCFAFVKL